MFHSDSPWRAKTNFTIRNISFLFSSKSFYPSILQKIA
ncbi:hypothetical protein STRIC_0441 [Streptococcus ictaluri 707-05]|uniref:Uncharacterized protein n=1 Tax=Streptococcus ictaluri 707-05 TaxID=764299 RepID=G5K5V3_9STRE|nr:hypothetical protein STRIC_0441 [Streptococcus ictaluri 707-05]